jgi:hypothetical protein
MVDTRASPETLKRSEWRATPESPIQNLLIINSGRSEDCLVRCAHAMGTICDVH